MSLFSYPAKFTTGIDGRVLVEFIDLPRVSTDGKDEREAMEEAIDALGSDLSIRLSRREEIPTPSTGEARAASRARAAVARTEACALLSHARAARQQLRVGSPPGAARTGGPSHARSRTRHQGREDPSRPRGPRQADDRRSSRCRVGSRPGRNGPIDVVLDYDGGCGGAGNHASSRLSAGWTRWKAGPQPG